MWDVTSDRWAVSACVPPGEVSSPDCSSPSMPTTALPGLIQDGLSALTAAAPVQSEQLGAERY